MKYRKFIALICQLSFLVFEAHASEECVTVPTSNIIINVMDKGAKGDGKMDDTIAIQAAINEVTGTGGTVLIPNGTYMINAVASILVKNNMTLRMSSGAILKAIPNDKANYSIINIVGVSNVNVIGGTLFGERDVHLGTTGEWGMGILIRSASNVTIEQVTVKNTWGDGFYISGASKNIKFCSVIADNNRRQGMSIISADGVIIKDSIFKNTNGTAPQAGIDIEPNNNEVVNNVQIIKSKFIDNKGRGIQIYVPLNTKSSVHDISIEENNVTGNQGGGIWFQNTGHNNIHNNTVKQNNHWDIFLANGTNENTVSKNILSSRDKIIDQGKNKILDNIPY